MIDMHIHVVHPRLPGLDPFPDFIETGPEATAKVLREEMQQTGITRLMGMGYLSEDDQDPLGINSTLQISEMVPGLHAIGVINPAKTDTDHLQDVEKQLQMGRVKALKGYLGYLYYGPDDPEYIPYYELAARYHVPVIFHTGDNYSRRAKVKYAHPLRVDEVAVDHRNVNFVLAHFGNPWITDAAEVVYKNENVWADLSGLIVGDVAYFQQLEQTGFLGQYRARIQEGMAYVGRPDKFLFGTDWPLAPLSVYRDFVRAIVPEKHQQAVFEDNASRLFQL